MHINEASQQSGVSAPAIRYYEKLGLLASIGRTASGYRDFSDHDIALLVFLRKARELGYSLEQCRELLTLVAVPQRSSEQNIKRTRALALRRLNDIDSQIAELERVRELVRTHVDNIGVHNASCPVTRSLAGENGDACQ